MNTKYVTIKTFYITVIFICCFMLLCLFTAVYFIRLRENESPETLSIPVRTIETEPDITKNDDILYVVAEHNGRIGIFDPSRTTLFELLDVYVDYLPDIDRQYLENGINIYTNDELLSVIADYTG